MASERSSKRSTAFEILGSAAGSTRHNRRGLSSTIDIKDLIESSERYSNKIGSPFIAPLNKPMTYTFQKDSGKRDFVSATIRANSTKLGPNHYKIVDLDGFVDKESPKKIRFAFCKDQKTSILA